MEGCAIHDGITYEVRRATRVPGGTGRRHVQGSLAILSSAIRSYRRLLVSLRGREKSALTLVEGGTVV